MGLFSTEDTWLFFCTGGGHGASAAHFSSACDAGMMVVFRVVCKVLVWRSWQPEMGVCHLSLEEQPCVQQQSCWSSWRLFQRKKYTIFAMSTGGRTVVWEVQRSPCPGGYLALSLEHLRDDEIVLRGRCLGKEIHLIRISWWRAWFKKTSLLSAAIKPLLKSHLFQ